MRLESIAFKHFQRRKGHFFFLVLGISLAMTTVVSLYLLVKTMNLEVGNAFDEIGPNIIITPKESNSALTYGNITIPKKGKESMLTSQDYILINTIPNKENIATVAPKLLQPVDIEGTPYVVAGVYFQFEKQLKKWWKLDGKWPFAENEILLGSEAAEQLEKKTGDTLTFKEKEFLITAVLDRQGTEEDNMIYANIMTVQTLFNRPDQLTFIEVAAYCTTCPLPQIIEQIKEKLPETNVIAMKDAVKAREQTIDRFAQLATAISIIVVMIGVVVVTLTMMASVKDRTREIGVFRAIGYRKSHVAEMVLTEAAIVGLFGGFTGFIFGTLLAKGLSPVFMVSAPTISWDYLLGSVILLSSTILGIISGFIPAVQASRMVPTESLRHI
ncbi:ABC transporter permease [Microaerobacter geothermalis]|uniref:ABC transporter permease n=1 Tax=Microaerobacter geothermalis TaxID=674972 RepID=UPI001F2DBB39|nr:FtsX-like permease family protein [Microaerobacter geothermalis]MCF6095166.1 ABC transporter permease [Microaerobacter geothermalis]